MDIIIELGVVNCFTCSPPTSWTATNQASLAIPVSSLSPLIIDGVTLVEVEGDYLVLPNPGAYVLPGVGGRRSIVCSTTFEARLTSPGKQLCTLFFCCQHSLCHTQYFSPTELVTPTFFFPLTSTVNEFTPLTINCINGVPPSIGGVQIFNPAGESVGGVTGTYSVPNVTRAFAGIYRCVVTSVIDANVTKSISAEVIIQCKFQ